MRGSSASLAIELSLHQIRNRGVQVLDDQRRLYSHEFAVVEDENMVSLETPDGGRAWIHGAGPDGDWQRSTAISISIAKLSAELARIIHSHATQGKMVIAIWPGSRNDNYVYAWEREAAGPESAADVPSVQLDVRSVPAEVFVPESGQTDALPMGWPNATVCERPEQLLAALTSLEQGGTPRRAV